MRQCFNNCFFSAGGFILAIGVIAAIYAYFQGISIIILGISVASIPAGIVAALVALAGIAVIGLIGAAIICDQRCRRRFGG